MRTIKSLINEEVISRASERAIVREENIEDVYYRYPELQKIDEELLALRGSRMLAVFDKNEEPIKAIEVREEELKKAREAFISKNGIDPLFDEEKAFCQECDDTGYIEMANGKNAVCRSCMKSQIEDCFNSSGLKDYSTYKIKNFDRSLFGNKKERSDKLKSMMKLFEEDLEGCPLKLYSDRGGSGKTFLAVVVTKYAILEGKNALYTKAETFLDVNEDEKDDYKLCEMLIVDDYSAEITRKWQIASALNSILEARMASNRPTVIISSSSKEQLVMESDERIAKKIERSNLI